MSSRCLLEIAFKVVAGFKLADGQPTRWSGLLGRKILTETALHVSRLNGRIVKMLGSVPISGVRLNLDAMLTYSSER